MPTEMHHNRYAGSVHMDAVRGTAAIVVLLGHSHALFFRSFVDHGVNTPATLFSSPINAKSHPQISIGNEAVMIFVVLSGYLVGGSVLRSFRNASFSWSEYLNRRLTRLWVVLTPTLMFTLAVDHIGLRLFPGATSIYAGPTGQTEVASGLAHSLSLPIVIGNFLFLQRILVPTLGTNVVLWSLSNEFWYYCLFPLFLLAVSRVHAPQVRLASFGIFALLLMFIGQEATLFPVWLLGAVVGLLPLRVPDRISYYLLIGLGSCLIPVILFVRVLHIPMYFAQMIVALYFAALLYIIVNRRGPARGGVYQRTAVLLSDLSYPLYLVHLPILVLFCACLDKPWRRWTESPVNLAAVLCIDLIALIVAYLFHLAFQRHTDKVRSFVGVLLKDRPRRMAAAD